MSYLLITTNKLVVHSKPSALASYQLFFSNSREVVEQEFYNQSRLSTGESATYLKVEKSND